MSVGASQLDRGGHGARVCDVRAREQNAEETRPADLAIGSSAGSFRFFRPVRDDCRTSQSANQDCNAVPKRKFSRGFGCCPGPPIIKRSDRSGASVEPTSELFPGEARSRRPRVALGVGFSVGEAIQTPVAGLFRARWASCGRRFSGWRSFALPRAPLRPDIRLEADRSHGTCDSHTFGLFSAAAARWVVLPHKRRAIRGARPPPIIFPPASGPPRDAPTDIPPPSSPKSQAWRTY